MENRNWKERVRNFVQGFFSNTSETFVEQILNDEKDTLMEEQDVFESEEELNMGLHYEETVTDNQNTEIRDSSFIDVLGKTDTTAIKTNPDSDSDKYTNLDSSDTQNSTPITTENDNFVSSEIPASNIEQLLKELSILIDELDAVLAKESISNVVETIKFCQDRIIEIMLRNGGILINVENGFDIARHRTVPFKIVEQGFTINKVIRPGVSLNGITIVKAIVETS